jgi:protein TonB
VTVPNTAPTPKSGASIDRAGNAGKSKGSPDSKLSNAQTGGPLPFLSQTDINEFAKKGQTEESTHNPLSDVTEAYKFLPYGRAVFNRLNQNLKYPELASLTGLQGEVYLIFEIKKDGSLGDITITKSSGYKLLDDEVVRTIRGSAPFQPLPEEWHKDRLIFPSVGVFHIYEKRLE